MWLPDAPLIYNLAYLAFKIFLWTFMRLQVEGRENVPKTGGCVLVCNHTRGNDYFALGVAAPRQICYMAKIEAFEIHPFLTWIMRQGGVIPIHRGAADMEALQMAVQVVRSGKILGMYPEGTRSPDGVLQSGKTGATRIALDAEAVIIPVVVIGAEAAWKNVLRFRRRPVVIVRFGKPFSLDGSSSRDRGAVVKGTRRIMMEIAALLPSEMRGEWGARLEGEKRR